MARTFLRLLFGGVLGKLLAIVREVLLAALFGAGRAVAANRIALTATLIPVNFFTADALTSGFLPLFVHYRGDRPAMAAALYRGVRLLLLTTALLTAVALVVGRDGWVRVLGPGLDPYTSRAAASMLGIAALGIPCYIQFNLYTLVALAHDDVRLINARASLQSVGLIGATLAAYVSGEVALLAWGFTVPYVLLCGWGMIRVRRRGYLTVGPVAPGVEYRAVFGVFWRRLRPLLLIPVLLQGSIAVERAVGSLLGVAVVAATEYSRFIVDSCMALLAAPLGLAGLTFFAKVDSHDVVERLRRLVPPVLFVTIALSVVLCVNSRSIVTVLYARGEFDQHAIDVSSVMLLGFALGIWADVLGYTLVKVMNARGQNARATVVMALSFSVAAAVNLLLYREWGPFTLGAAASAGGVVMFVAAAFALGILRDCVRLLAALLPGVAAAAYVGHVLSGSGPVRLASSAAGILMVWAVFGAVVPGVRRTFVSQLRAMMRPGSARVAVTARAEWADGTSVPATTKDDR